MCTRTLPFAVTKTISYVCLVISVILPSCAYAQSDPGRFMFTVTPPLIQVALQPGESWSTTIQVVNQNAYEVAMYAEPVLFKPGGESGRPVFIRTIPGTDEPIAHDQSEIAGWISVPQEPVRVAPEQTYELPVRLTIPEEASPGGHYAAILIGNTPTRAKGENSISVSSSIASLIFVRVAGDVVESGQIREFSTERMVYERPEALLKLRFENKGNVHLQPRGAITIYNMFGKVRGKVEVNPEAGYGNVLPGSVREFAFSWKADTGMWDIGRYRAVATLGYGKDQTSFVSSTLYFWVLPVVPFLEIVAACGLLVYALLLGVRRYIRRALALETAAHADTHNAEEIHTSATQVPVAPVSPRLTVRALVRPLSHGLLDLRAAQTSGISQVVHIEKGEVRTRVRMRSIFFVCIGIIAVGASMYLVHRYMRDVMNEEHTYSLEELHTDEPQP